MFKAYLYFLSRWFHLFIWQWWHLKAGSARAVIRNVVFAVAGIPLVGVVLHIHWFFFLIDGLFFSAYRQVAVKAPLFITGVPRSGTTFLQRTLSKDPQFTTTTLAECLFAPAVSERYLLAMVSRLLRPFRSAFAALAGRFSSKMEGIHTLGLNEAEEDFLLLLPVLSSFIQMVVFPADSSVWKLASFETAMKLKDRELILDFYHRMIQKHLYFHGQELTYLSKNPSFTSWIASLRQGYPDSVIIACVREPEKTVPSQISSLGPAFELLGHDLSDKDFIRRITGMLLSYYQRINLLAEEGGVLCTLEMETLKTDLYACISAIYELGDYPMSEEIRSFYAGLSEKNKQYRSDHQYRSESRVETSGGFASVWPVVTGSALLKSREKEAV